MEDTSLMRLAVGRQFVSELQIENVRKEQAELADRGIKRSLWSLCCERRLITHDQESILRREIRTTTHRARMIAGYRIVRRLGRGGMGEVFLAVGSDNTHVALKLLPQCESQSKEAEPRFRREAHTLLLLDNPNIVRGITAGTDRGQSYLVMEYVKGMSLKERIDKRTLLSAAEALVLLVQASLGLRCAWRCGILHRDVKPSNILLAPQRADVPEPFCAKICDFGLARPFRSYPGDQDADIRSDPGLIIGTPLYMSPEQLQGSDDLEQRSDIFSLAATIYHAIVGRPIQVAENLDALTFCRMHEDVDLEPLAQHDVPSAFVGLLDRMLKRQRSQRIQDWDWVLHACNQVDPVAVRPFLKNQPGYIHADHAAPADDPCRRYAELASSRIDYIASGLEFALLSAQRPMMSPSDVDFLAQLRRDVTYIRALAQNLEVMVQGRKAHALTIDLRALADCVMGELGGLAARLKIQLNADGDGSAVGDPTLSRNALLNVVRNGVLACRSGGVVRIRIKDHFIVVADQGYGIPPQILKSIFDPKSPDRVFGLGATAARTCQRRQGGDVRILVSGEGGTAFCLFWARDARQSSAR